jgi:hypothetical protein
MTSQLQLHSQYRINITSTSDCTFSLGKTLTGTWELCYALIPNVAGGDLTLRISIDGYSKQILIPHALGSSEATFTIGLTAAPGAYQEYKGGGGRKQYVNFGPQGVQSLSIKIKDDDNDLVDFGALEWVMILQKVQD